MDPVIAPSAALAFCCAINAVYVGALHLARKGDRNDPAVIWSRIVATGLVCGVAWVPLAAVIASSASRW